MNHGNTSTQQHMESICPYSIITVLRMKHWFRYSNIIYMSSFHLWTQHLILDMPEYNSHQWIRIMISLRNIHSIWISGMDCQHGYLNNLLFVNTWLCMQFITLHPTRKKIPHHVKQPDCYLIWDTIVLKQRKMRQRVEYIIYPMILVNMITTRLQKIQSRDVLSHVYAIYQQRLFSWQT